MSSGSIFAAAVGVVVRRPLVTIAVVVALAIAGGVGALGLRPSAGTDTLVSGSSDSARETERFKASFGDEAVVVLAKGDLQRTLYTADLGRLIGLEDCLSGNLTDDGPRSCREIAELDPARVVFGPGTFIGITVQRLRDGLLQASQARDRQSDQAAAAALSQARADKVPAARARALAAQAREAVERGFQYQQLGLGARYRLARPPSIDDPDFIDTLVFERPRGIPTDVPKARFSSLFPSRDAALIQVRLRPGLSDGQRTRAIELIHAATGERVFRLEHGEPYVVTGVPVVVDGLAREVGSGILWLLGASVLVMAATLALVFRTRLRLLPLGLALAAAAMTYGVLALTGGSLTMASIAVLPVLIGLAVDYAIQFHARFDELRSSGRDGPAAAAAVAAAGAGGPTIATAGIATAMGFLVLLLSPAPMVRGFGLLVVAGIAIALACALTAGFAALGRFADRPGRPRPADLPPTFPRLRVLGSRLGARLVLPARAREWAQRSLAYSVRRPQRVLAIGLAIAIAGWAADTQSHVTSDVRELVPADLRELRDVKELERETGVAGELNVTVRADDITRPEVISWMGRFQAETLRDAGYEEGERCAQERDPPALCPALSLPTLLGGADSSDQVRGLLDAVPGYFSRGVVTGDRTTANLAFGIRLQSLEDQKRLIDAIERRLDPPAGVTASVVGLPVLAAEANGALSSPWRRALTLVLALLAVFAVLLAIRRSVRQATVPLIPIALATGWSAGILFALGLLPGPLEVDLNPMSVTLGALVIAISTEFSVLLCARYRAEREAGADPARAIDLTYASTGRAVLASGVTAIAGFAALMASDIRMLRDFGILTVVDLSVSLLGVLLVLPAALVWAEEHGALGIRGLDPRRLLRRRGARPGPRRRPVRRPSVRALRGRLRGRDA